MRCCRFSMHQTRFSHHTIAPHTRSAPTLTRATMTYTLLLMGLCGGSSSEHTVFGGVPGRCRRAQLLHGRRAAVHHAPYPRRASALARDGARVQAGHHPAAPGYAHTGRQPVCTDGPFSPGLVAGRHRRVRLVGRQPPRSARGCLKPPLARNHSVPGTQGNPRGLSL